MKYALDLCSGTKGALAAFDDFPGWQVVTVDIDPELNPTHVLDLTNEEPPSTLRFDMGEP